MDTKKIYEQAKKEIEQEDFEIAVRKMKEKLREKRSFWDRIIPWKIIIIKKESLKWGKI